MSAKDAAAKRSTRSAARLSPGNREKQILDGAISYFAEVGLAGQTRELAERLGITQPLVYRYFPTKRDLIDRVFDTVFVKRLDAKWISDLRDQSRPLNVRLCEFYNRYSTLVCRYEWIRIYMFASLLGKQRGCEYIQIAEDEVLKLVCEAVRSHFGLPSVTAIPISELELEQFWMLHSGLYYYAIRKYIYHSRVYEDLPAIITRNVEITLAGLKTFVKESSKALKSG
jgi:AcrR family transcriptional regulator